ncbi:penicillin-binding protein 2 [Fluviicoccus keumensis]|uniref:Peptidoglycan D,D-transpeptidase MrdA n=1 Tax=Fluviicoccus keumensis TaxID=1435465 RepID=A0A4Q7YHN2_9GAMM|nr:penicillin-binding protein 2 [Fluviicoccus keumensis]RZU37042.1 penicillin-binding protein 2 [Fluviicoccus keumensis]
MAPKKHLKDSQLEAALFRRRAQVAGLMVFLAFSLLIVRYGWLQIVQHERYQTLSDNNRIKLQAIAPPRGYIYDRNGVLLADNRPAFTATLNREEARDINDTLVRLAPVLQLSPDDIQRFRTRLKTASPFENIPVKINLSEADIARFAEVRFDFPGIDIEVKQERYYPHGELFAHALGYVGRISEDEAGKIDPAVYSGTDLIGKTGIEKFYEKLLQGRPGYQYIEANAHGQMLRPLDRTAPTRGDDLVLHLDYGLQKLATEQLAGRRGAIVAIDPDSGGVMAFVSYPSFDPNAFVDGIPYKLYTEWRDHPDRPLYNRALQGIYPPGSTIKPFSGMGGLNYGLVDWDFKISDPGYYHLPGDTHIFRDWKKNGHGTVNLHKAIEQSCDTYFYQLAARIGVDRFHDWMQQFGFGQLTGIDLVSEKSGTLPSTAWKRSKLKAPWYPGEMLSVGIGQGYFTVTPLQLAMATAIMANKGRHITPHLLKSVTGPFPFTPANQPDGHVAFNGNPVEWDRMHDAMKAVVHGNGTATSLRRGLEGYEIAGKTGTAQVKGIKQGEKYSEARLDPRHWDHAWFMGFAPADKPKVALAVLVENGKHGGSAAGPIARAMFDYVVHGTVAPAPKIMPPVESTLPAGAAAPTTPPPVADPGVIE